MDAAKISELKLAELNISRSQHGEQLRRCVRRPQSPTLNPQMEGDCAACQEARKRIRTTCHMALKRVSLVSPRW